MEAILTFFTAYGWQLSLIAILGIVILGVLKYANVFNKLEKSKRKIVYFAITVGFSLIASAIYLAIVGGFTLPIFCARATAIYALNQTFYAIYETTSLRDLFNKFVDILVKFIQEQAKKADKGEDK